MKKSYRKVMGERLKEFRTSRGLSAYRVALNGNIRMDQVKAIESGEVNYTIDAFLGYIAGCDLYIYFAEKSPERLAPHDFVDLANGAIEKDPNRKI